MRRSVGLLASLAIVAVVAFWPTFLLGAKAVGRALRTFALGDGAGLTMALIAGIATVVGLVLIHRITSDPESGSDHWRHRERS